MFRFKILYVLSIIIFLSDNFSQEITFFATSDIHYGLNNTGRAGSRPEVRNSMLQHLNNLPGTKYPDSEDLVAEPKGLIIPGDMIHRPWSDTEWEEYTTAYGLTGDDAVVNFPIYDGAGNHEIQQYPEERVPSMQQRTLKRHELFGLKGIDSINWHYSWEWEGVHFVNLNMVPNGEPTVEALKNVWYGPQGAAEFLEWDLIQNVGTSGRPIIIMNHLPYDSRNDEAGWSTKAKDDFVTSLENYNCVAIIHGHSHREPLHYQYQGLDVFDDGANMNGDMMVFRISDGKLQAYSRYLGEWGSLKFEKTISMGDPLPLSPDVIGGLPIRFSLARQGVLYSSDIPFLKVEIYDISGHRVKMIKPSGPNFLWKGDDESGKILRSGIYFARFIGVSTSSNLKFYFNDG